MNILRRLCFVITLVLAAAASAFAGIDAWSSTTNYGLGYIVRGGDNNLYLSAGTGMNHNPINDVGTYWVLDTVCVNTTLPIGAIPPATPRFTTLAQTAKFVANAKIMQGCLVTISLITGTTETASVTLDFLNGSRVWIVGTGAAPGPTLDFSMTTGPDFNGIIIQAGSDLGKLSNVTIKGVTVTTANYNPAPPANPTAFSTGITVQSAAALILAAGVTVNNFDAGVQVNGGSITTPTPTSVPPAYTPGLGLTINGSADMGIISQQNGRAVVPSTTVTNVYNYSGTVGFGMAVGDGGEMICNWSDVSSTLTGPPPGETSVDYLAQSGSVMYAYQVAASGPVSNSQMVPTINATGNYNAIIYGVWVNGDGGGNLLLNLLSDTVKEWQRQKFMAEATASMRQHGWKASLFPAAQSNQ